jgi:hypothetical protein
MRLVLLRELLGWIGTGFILYSFLFSDMKRVRLYNAVGAIFWILFGIETSELPIVILNGTIFFIHLRWFMKEDLLFPPKGVGNWKDVDDEMRKWLSEIKHEPDPKSVIMFMKEKFKPPVKKN